MVNTLRYKEGDYISFHSIPFIPDTVGRIENILKEGTWLRIKVKTISGLYIYLYKYDKFKVISKERYLMEVL